MTQRKDQAPPTACWGAVSKNAGSLNIDHVGPTTSNMGLVDESIDRGDKRETPP